ncbi:MAG: 2TM domain-containing protein [Desulfobacteraceae bacterium]|nr:2TM domain-containing protein [Desulfobacteraceae bacterium]
MTENTPRQYTTDDINRIIRRALKMEQTESITHGELLETAKELGIDPGRIEEAIKLEASAMEDEKQKSAYLIRKRAAFKSRLWGFVILNTFIFVLNCILPGPWWFQWVLLGTGISLAFGFRNAYAPSEHRMERSMRRYGRRQNRLRGRRLSEMK